MKLTIVRHTSVDVPEGICYGFTDVNPKASFKEEAAQVMKQLKGKKFDTIFTSPLIRCSKLADFCGYPDAIRDEKLKEMNFGDWEMKSWMELDKVEASTWFADWLNFPAKNGESYAQMKIRVDNFMDELKASAINSACIFTHSGVIRLIHVYAGICRLEESFEFPVKFGHIFDLEIN